MSRCVPTWDIDDSPTTAATTHRSLRSPATAAAADIPMLDYEVAELTWENGQLALHGLGLPRTPAKAPPQASPSKYVWDKPHAGGTLESIVNQATGLPNPKARLQDELVPWFDNHRVSTVPATGTATMTMDALVPEQSAPVGVGCSTRVGSCSGRREEDALGAAKRARLAAARGPAEWSSRDQISVSGSATVGRDQSRRVTMDSYEMEMGMGFTSTSMGSPENTSSGKPCTKTTTVDDHDSVCHSRPQREAGDDEEDKKKVAGKSSVSTKRSRAAAIHNQSERKRRDKINQRMKTLQKLVPNSSKTDKASMLDEVIEYLKQLQGQVSMMSRMNMTTMMLPMAMQQQQQQQLQMSMMSNAMGVLGTMGMGMGMNVMDTNSMNRNLIPNPNLPFIPSCDSNDYTRFHSPLFPDPISTFLSSQSHVPQPMTMDAYSRMAALYQQMQQQLPPPSIPKS